MKRIWRRIVLGLSASALVAFPMSLLADGPCEELCIDAATDLIAYADWDPDLAYKVMISCVKGCSVPG